MLSEIRIRDLGVIEEAILEIGPGLTVLTGETGAGKTMIVTALGLLLGTRADSSLVRNGARRTSVEGLVQLGPTHPARRRAAEAGADEDDPDLVLVRTVGADGRSRAHVGGHAAPIGLLAELGELLVAVHGQADQWRLRRPEQHRDLLDRFGGEEIDSLRTAYGEAYDGHRTAAAELRELTEHALERAREAEALTAALERIERLDPAPGEDLTLAVEAERLGHLEELRASAGQAAELLAGSEDAGGRDEPGILGALARVRAVLDRGSDNDPQLAGLAARATELSHLIADLSSDVTHYLADLDVDPARLETVQQRRAALAEVTRLYGPTVDDVLTWGATAAQRLGSLLGDDDRLTGLGLQVDQWATRLEGLAVELTRVRTLTARRLTAAIGSELAALGTPGSRVDVAVKRRQRLGPAGADDVEIGWAPNSGTELRSVSRAASGGELSRIMLAIEVATAEGSDGPPTFVFDEVDAGVGGRAALSVGARLAALAEHSQVIVVTHLAQVAAHADHHLVIHKADDGQVTRSGVTRVEGEERVRELARMLAGTDSVAALDHARDLLGQVGRAPTR